MIAMAAAVAAPSSPSDSSIGRFGGAAATRPRTNHRASSSPAAPPATASTRLSVINCRTNRTRLAPSAVRTAISRARSEPRASNRFARLTQAISRTNATPISRTNIPSRISGSTTYSRTGTRSVLQPLRELGCSTATRSAMATTRARACSMGTPSPSRAIDRKIMLSRRVRMSSLSSAVRIGSQSRCSSATCGPRGRRRRWRRCRRRGASACRR